MAVCFWRLPSFPPGLVPSRGSTNQNVAGVRESLYDRPRDTPAYRVREGVPISLRCRGSGEADLAERHVRVSAVQQIPQTYSGLVSCNLFGGKP